MSDQAAIIGMGLMGQDIAALFLAGSWSQAGEESAEAAWFEKPDPVSTPPGRTGANLALTLGLKRHSAQPLLRSIT